MKTASIRRYCLAATAVAAVAAAGHAAFERVDFGNGFQLLWDDIASIAFSRSDANAPAGEYDTMTVTLPDGTSRTMPITQAPGATVIVPDKSQVWQIDTVGAAHAYIQLFDCLNNPDPNTGLGVMDPTKPFDWHGAPFWRDVHWEMRCELGFDASYTVVGALTGHDYARDGGFVWASSAEDNLLGLDCMAFHMPNEPVTITTTDRELTTYVGAPFIGTYTGMELAGDPATRVATGRGTAFTAEFRTNGTYRMTSTDRNALDMLELYDWTAETNAFRYNYTQPDRLTYNPDHMVAEGRFFDTNHAWIDLSNYSEDKQENQRHYLASRTPATYSVVDADQYRFRQLAQITPDGGQPLYFLIEDYGHTRTPLTATFTQGSDIADTPVVAYFANQDGDGTPAWRLTRTAADALPAVMARGPEAGTYTGPDGALELDGFDAATLGGRAGTYVLDGAQATVTIDGAATTYVLDLAAHTYALPVADGWTGPKAFSSSAVQAFYNGKSLGAVATMTLRLDSNLKGEALEGYAALEVSIPDQVYGGVHNAISDAKAWSYDASTHLLTVEAVNVGLATSPFYGKRNVVFRVADDLQTLWLDTDAMGADVLISYMDEHYSVATGAAGSTLAAAE